VGVFRFFQYLYTIVFLIGSFIYAMTMMYFIIGGTTNDFSSFQRIFIIISAISLIFFSITFLGNLFNSHKNIEKWTPLGLIVSLVASIFSVGILGLNQWGGAMLPSGF